jgi:hypothetical protein
MVFGYNVKEEAQEIKTELTSSRNDLLLIGIGTLMGSVAASVIRTSDIVQRLKDWYEGRSDQEEEEE